MTRRTTAVSEDSNFEAMVAETAYYKAQQRGFAPGAELADWLAAEREVHAMLGEIDAPATKRRRTVTGSRASAKAPKKRATRKPREPEAL